MRKFIRENIRYAPVGKCSVACKQGVVYISFTVEKDGSITNIQAVEEVSGAPEFTSEAIRVISLFPRFSPAKKKDGNTVRCKLTVPVRFSLQ
jgi:TonB family protein